MQITTSATRSMALIAALALVLAACGGTDSIAVVPPDDPAPAPADIAGVAMPASVAVVSATNAE